MDVSIHEEGNQKIKKMSYSFFYFLGVVQDESLMRGFASQKEARNPLSTLTPQLQ
jgi:hypothetical protein